MADPKASKPVGRPTQNAVSRAITEFRPENRTPVGNYRDILTVNKKDPGFEYRWVRDTHEEGTRILRFLEAGWAFVPAGDVSVGQVNVFNSRNSNIGSIVRRASGPDTFLYLMRINRDWYEEDQAAKQRHVDELEDSMRKSLGKTPDKNTGEYGEVKIGR